MACATALRKTMTVVAELDGPTPKPEQWRNSGIYSPGADAVYVSTN